MMNIQTIKATMNGLVSKYGEEEAIERFLEKHSEYEGEMYMVLNGEDELPETMKYTAPEDELPETMKYTAPEDELPEVEDEAETIAETPVEVKADEPKAEKPKKEKKAKVVTEKAAKGPSKMDQAKAIYMKLEDKSRKNVCKVLMEQLDMTAAGSSTYAQLLKKWFESQQA